MKKPFVISISGISGGGKTTVITALKKRLANSAVIYWDNYGDEVDLDRDINEWAANGHDYNEWNTKPVADDIARLLNEPYDYIILDYPFGYLNEGVGKYINLTVFIDTPLDVALARRIIRDYTSRSQENDFGLADIEELSFAGLDKELRWYLTHSRPTYAMSEMHIPVSDLVVDGVKPIDEIVEKVLDFVKKISNKESSIIYTNTVTVNDYNMLRQSAGWPVVNAEQAQAGIIGSAFIVSAKDNKKTVGVGRLIWDGGDAALIKDVLVLPEYQGMGIGTHITEQLLAFLKNRMKPGWSVSVDLMAAIGKEGFYEKFGFVSRPRDRRGAGMDLRITN